MAKQRSPRSDALKELLDHLDYLEQGHTIARDEWEALEVEDAINRTDAEIARCIEPFTCRDAEAATQS